MKEKTALITGAASGIGREVVICLANSGYKTFILLDIDEGSLIELKQELEAKLKIVHLVVSDIASCENLKVQLHVALKEVSGLCTVVLSAGIGSENDPEDELTYNRLMDVNFNGACAVVRQVLPHVVDDGSFVFISSIWGILGNRRNTGYCASKHALYGYAKALALDVAARRINVNTVMPAWVDTPMLRKEIEVQARMLNIPSELMLKKAKKKLPFKRFITASEVAEAVKFLASDSASGITAQRLVIDGGVTCGV